MIYKGHPLYLYAKDKDDGDTYGQGLTSFGAGWYVLTPRATRSTLPDEDCKPSTRASTVRLCHGSSRLHQRPGSRRSGASCFDIAAARTDSIGIELSHTALSRLPRRGKLTARRRPVATVDLRQDRHPAFDRAAVHVTWPKWAT